MGGLYKDSTWYGLGNALHYMRTNAKLVQC